MNSIIKDYCNNNATNVLDNDEYELVNLLFKEKIFVLCNEDTTLFKNSEDLSLTLYLSESVAENESLANNLSYVEVSDINWLYGQILKFKDLSFINFDDGDFSVTLDVGTFLSCLMCNNVKKVKL